MVNLCLNDINLSVDSVLWSHGVYSLSTLQGATENLGEGNVSNRPGTLFLCTCHYVVEARAERLHLSDVSDCGSTWDIRTFLHCQFQLSPFDKGLIIDNLRILGMILVESGTYDR